jgi:hypothetical protein
MGFHGSFERNYGDLMGFESRNMFKQEIEDGRTRS